MKVVFLHTDFRIYWPARLYSLNEFLKIKNISLDIIEISGKGSPYSFAESTYQQSLNWHVLFPDDEMERIFPQLANKEVEKKLNDIDPDIIFAGAIAFPSGAAAIRWAQHNNKKIIIFDDSRLVDTPRSFINQYIKRQIYSCVDAIFCPSPEWNKTYNFFGFENDHIFYGVDVVDNRYWQDFHYEKEADISPGYFLHVGRLVTKKNTIFLLKAYNNYLKKAINPRDLVLIGDGPLKCDIDLYLKKENLQSVKCLPFKSQSDLKVFYRNAWCYVLPSLFGETWGLTVNEAMASSLPILVSNQAGCASTLIKHGINGFNFSPNSVDELTNLLIIMGSLSIKKKTLMGKKSNEIISNWDLDRFNSGAFSAIKFVTDKNIKRNNIFANILIRLWKGRYRPT